MNNSENRLERKCSCCGGDNPEKQRIDAILEKYADVTSTGSHRILGYIQDV